MLHGPHKGTGYLYFFDSEHPLITKLGYIYYHRHVASLKIGRWLVHGEHVHHIDGNKLNNDPGNIQVTTGSAHTKIHHPGGLSRVAISCAECGKEFIPTCDKIRYCSQVCALSSREKFKISKEELKKLVWEMPQYRVASLLGVSDHAIEKRCRKLGIQRPKYGHWQRIKANEDKTIPR